MDNFLEKLHLLRPSPKPLGKGFFVYHSPGTYPDQYRLHLRVEPDGNGVLIVNASSILHLNLTATEMAYYLMQGKSDEQTVKIMASRFAVPAETIAQDVSAFNAQLLEFIRKEDQEPVANFGFEPITTIGDISAPYRLDCCLSYLTEGEPAMADSPELDTQAWKAIIQKAFDAGIPHIIFYGGEPTLREDLCELLQSCEDLGLVTGLVSSGRKLNEESYVEHLISSGLDHLFVPFIPEDTVLMEALRKVLPLDLYTCVYLRPDADRDYRPIVQELSALGTNAFALTPGAPEFAQRYLELNQAVIHAELPLVTDMPLPVQESRLVKEYAGHAEIAPETEYVTLSVHPDGEVFSSFSCGHSMGNLAAEAWDKIWERRFQEQA